MNQILQEAIAGEPVTVTLGGETYPLAFPMQAVILYKSETARLDRARAKDRVRLTMPEKRSLRERRQKLLADADRLRPGKNEDWQPDNFLEYDLLNDEASALKIALDEDAGTGDSLYNMYNWRKISPDEDPERLLLALWVGLHRFVDVWAHKPVDSIVKYQPPLSREELGGLINLANGGDLLMAVSKALTAHLIAPREEDPREEETVSSQPSALGEDDEPFDAPNPRGDFDPNPPAEIPPQQASQGIRGIEERRKERRPPMADMETAELPSRRIPK